MRGSLVVVSMAMLLLGSSGGVVAASSGGGFEGERASVTGKVLSYAWLLSDRAVKGQGNSEGQKLALEMYGAKLGYKGYGYPGVGDVFSSPLEHGLDSWGASYDAMLSLGLRSGRDVLGTQYGANFSLMVPAGSGGSMVFHGAPGIESRVFADTSLGNFSVGYQEGVESKMKVDVFGGLSGENGSAWGRYLRGFLKYAKGVPFHMYPGLYSENLFRSTRDLRGVSGVSAKTRDVLNSMPLRFSFESARLGGLSVGFSYSPTGYRDDMYKGGEFTVRDGIAGFDSIGTINLHTKTGVKFGKMIAVVPPRFDSGPVYKNIVSGAANYEYELADIAKFRLSLAGEYARPKKARDIVPEGRRKEEIYVADYNDLSAFSSGLEIDLGRLRFAVGGGYLGKSGSPKMYILKDVRHKVPYVKKKGLPSHYVTSAVSYTIGSFSATVAYFMSRLTHIPPATVSHEIPGKHELDSVVDGENTLKDLVVGVGYNLFSKGSTSLEVFLNCHMFSVQHKFNIHEYKVSTESSGFVLKEGGERANTNNGAVALLGMKFAF
ncbi:hypothetical protein AB9K21_03345 [Anaplasma phagocytophilum]|uniref:Uncharacterized protein n=1 Tax=Anaplasma phagocytophilum str. ApMUC09 TaxID=1359152 RepID=A0A0F3N924_ANAPH|nr:hypothetical protein APHMUC_0044 [Anaplasma phagocytophilum str. ApMUC09]SCV62377.1 hypothetical protein ANAPH2_00283 [Anaplasma phagocytophilum]